MSRFDDLTPWVLRSAMLPVAFAGFIFALWLEAALTWNGVGNPPPCYVSGRVCWGEAFWEALAYALGAIIFVMLPVIMELEEKFCVATVFYGIGVLFVLLGVTFFGPWQIWPMIFPPLITGLWCVYRVGRMYGYGSAARYFVSAPELTRVERIWLALRRAAMIPFALAIAFIMTERAPVIEDWIYSLCPPGNFIENDSEPASCINPGIERLVTLNGYAALILPLVLNIFGVALLEPVHKRLVFRIVWLIGSSFLVLLTPLFLLDSGRYLWAPVVAFVAGALCVWVVGRIYPAVPTGRLEAAQH